MEASVPLVTLWILFCCVLVFAMQAGFACFETGLVRTKNNINVAAKNFADTVVSVLIFSFIGYHLMFAQNLLDFSGTYGLLLDSATSKTHYHFLYQALFCGTAATIVSGAVAERMTYSGYIILTAIMASIVYPVIGRWMWNDTGWLAELGAIDFAGSTVVHTTGGWASLAAVLVIGPRLGRFRNSEFGSQCQNFPFAMLGVFILWIGWLGFNGGSSLTFDERTPLIILNTILGGIGGAVLPIALIVMRPERYSVFTILHGPIAGLVAVTAAANLLEPGHALVAGIAGGGLAVWGEKLLFQLRIDDGIGVIGPHLLAGILGTLIVPFVATDAQLATAGGFGALLLAQFLAIAATAIWAFGVTYVLLKIISRFHALRVTPREEKLGLNESEHGIITEFAAVKKQLDAQIKSVDIMGSISADPDSEIGALVSRHNEAIGAFNEKYEKWLGELTEKEATNNILRIRTWDLERALTRTETELRLSSKKVAEVGYLAESLVEAKDHETKKYMNLLSRATSLCAKSLNEILKEARSSKTWSSPQVAAAKMKMVTEQNDAILSQLTAIHLLVELEEVESITERYPLDFRQAISGALIDRQGKRTDVDVRCIVSTSLPVFVGDAALLERAIGKLIARAIGRAHRQVTIKCQEQHAGLILEVSDDGQRYPDIIIDSLGNPLAEILENVETDLENFDVELGLISRIAEVHGATFKVSNLDPCGTNIYIEFPEQESILAKTLQTG